MESKSETSLLQNVLGQKNENTDYCSIVCNCYCRSPNEATELSL